MSAQMVEVLVFELKGKALAYAVALAEGYTPTDEPQAMMDTIEGRARHVWIHPMLGTVVVVGTDDYRPQERWAEGGPLMDAYRVGFALYPESYFACTGLNDVYGSAYGETHLIAACRAIVAANLGDRVQVPAELVKGGA